MLTILSALMLVATAHAADMSLVDYMGHPARPIDATLAINEASTTEGTIGNNGGSLELKTSDGSIFKLTVPAGALEQPVLISMTELKSFSHASFDEPSVGVQLSPEGLMFEKPATLKIQPKKPIPLASLVPMTADHDGRDVRLATLDPAAQITPNSVELSLGHFSPYSLAGSLTMRETILRAFNRLGAARIESWASDQILKIKQGQPHDPDFLYKTLADGFEKVVKVQANSVESCQGGIEAQKTLLGWTRNCQLLGFDPSSFANDNFNSVLVAKTAKYCRERARVACYEDHRPFDVMAHALEVNRMAQLMGVENDPDAAALEALALKCFHFEFEMTSSLGTEDPMESTVTAKAKMEFWMDSIIAPLQSRGEIKVTANTLDLEGLDCKQTSLTAPPGQATVVEFGLKDIRFDQSLGISIQGFYPYSMARFICKDQSSPPNSFPLSLPMMDMGPESSYWGGEFLALHSQPTANEYNVKKGQFEIFKWDVKYGEFFAEKKYSRTHEALREETVMKIYHRPQQ